MQGGDRTAFHPLHIIFIPVIHIWNLPTHGDVEHMLLCVTAKAVD